MFLPFGNTQQFVCPRPTAENIGMVPDGCVVCSMLAESVPEESELPEDNGMIPSIDCHIHCGIMKGNTPYEDIKELLDRAKIVGACLFSPVNEIYDRGDRFFYDSPKYQESRKKSNNYLVEVSRNYTGVYPFYFVWNDFETEGLENFKGVKWHRHSDEPKYDYSSDKCEIFLQKVYELKIPIIFEEEKRYTLEFITRVAGRTNIIIPHLGLLNGGYLSLKREGIWNQPNIYADCALAFSNVADFVATYGAEKLFLGSDYPFGKPGAAKRSLLKLHQESKLSTEQLHNICYNNIKKLIHI